MKQIASRVNIRIRGNGPLGGILVDAGLDGTVRGYVDNPTVELPPNEVGKLDVGSAVGPDGYLYVVRDVGYGYPYSSTVGLVSGEIGEDITHYLATSEQIPSALLLGVFVQADRVTAAGGLLVQVLPKGAQDENLLGILEARIGSLSGFTPLLREGKTLPGILQELLGDLDPLILPDQQPVRFHCGCSFGRMLGALKMLGEAELQDMIEKDKGAEAICQFCHETYWASDIELEGLLAEMRAKRQTQ